jgi:transglutaminase-like putative cysteine protease
MNRTENPAREPLHLLLVRAVVYSATLLILLAPMLTMAVAIAALAAALVGLVLGRALAASRVRTPVVLAGAALVVLTGAGIGSLLGSSSALAQRMGIPAALAVIQGCTFSLATLAVVASFRVLSLRRPALALIEVAAVAATVVRLFASHRDWQISQPRFLADWAFSHGLDPSEILMKVGVVTLLAMALLLLPRQRWTRTVAALAALLLLWFAFGYLLPGMAGAAGSGSGGSSQQQTPLPDEDTLNFGDRGDNQHPYPVALLTLHLDYNPIDGHIHLRDQVYTVVVANRLSQSSTPGIGTDLASDFPASAVAIAGPKRTGEIWKEVATTVALLIKHPRPVTLASPIGLKPEINPDRKQFFKVYGVQSVCLVMVKGKDGAVHPFRSLLTMKAGDPSWPSAVREQYLGIPNDHRYGQLAKQILADARKAGTLPAEFADSPLAMAEMFREWIRKNTIYSLHPGNDKAVDPTAEFLFGNHKGHCVYVSSALAYLLRSQGIPTRVVGGFAPRAGLRGHGSSLLVQSSDAHAWCEVYLDGAGWIPLEVAQDRSEDPPPPPPDEDLKNHLREKFGHDNTKYSGLKKRLEAGDQSALDEDPQADEQDDGNRLRIAWGGFPFGLLLLLYVIKVWRRLAPQFGSAKSLYRLAYRATLDRLADAGVLRELGETREDFAARLKAKAPEFQEMTLEHLRCALGGGHRIDRSDWLRLASDVRRRLPAIASLQRRLLGLINPVSWLWVH